MLRTRRTLLIAANATILKTVLLFVALMLAKPSTGFSQAVPSPGDRIRITQMNGIVLTGTLDRLSPEMLRLSIDSDDRISEVPVPQIEVLEASSGRGASRRNILLTVAVTSALGAALGGSAWEPCTFLCLSPFESEARSGAVFAGLGLGALVGLPLGFLIRSERWERVALPGPAAVSIRPLIGSRVGFVGSVDVRRF